MECFLSNGCKISKKMTLQEYKDIYQNICDCLAQRKLKPAFDKLEKFIHEAGQPLLMDEWRNLEQTYRYMLKYTVEGISDPERQKIYRKLIVSVYELTDKVMDAVLLKNSSSPEYELRRTFSAEFDFKTLVDEIESHSVDGNLDHLLNGVNVKSESDDSDLRFLHSTFRNLFYYFWLKNKLDVEELAFFRAAYQSSLIDVHYKAFLTSSLLMSLLRHFDIEKFNLLFDAYDQEDPEINQRALIALLLTLYKYDRRLALFPEIKGRLTILNESPEFRRRLEIAIIHLIRSKDTERIQKKISEEILPEMIRISPNLKNKINLDSLMDDSFGEDKNPQWERIFEDAPGLMDKMEEFSKLQMEGADVFISSFAMLKMFPFFNETANWFVPFFAQNPDLLGVVDSNDDFVSKFVQVIEKVPVLCNSDKYSFCLSIQNIPAQNRELMAEGLKAEMGQMSELQKDEELTDPGKKAGFIGNQFVQDLYRFFKLHPRRNEFENIFDWLFDFHQTEVLGSVLKEDREIVRNIGEFYFKKEYFAEAAAIFLHLLSEGQDGELYQKLGYCYQKLGDYRKALDYYLKAELYDLNPKWNLSKIALCYRHLKKPRKALEYYRAAEKLDDSDLNIQLNIGHCLLELNEYEEALKCYFRVDYLMPGNKKAWRPIAWCSFVVGKKEQAERYYLKLIEDEPNKHDWLNMGHVQWSLGRRKEALESYKKSIGTDGFGEEEFFKVFDEDVPYLVNQGVNPEDIPIMLDQLRYYLEE